MSNDYYVSSGVPATSSSGSSALVRAQFANVEDGFDKLPTLSGNGSKAVIINAGATGLSVTTGTLALAGNFATVGAYAVTLTATGATSLTLPTTGTLATTSNKLSAFAATTSAELAGVISDETGTGSLVFSNTPTLVTPVLGVATATSVNKMAITAPATGSTLAVAEGKTLTASNTLTLAGTDGTTMTFPSTSATLARTDAANTFTGVQTMTSPAITTPAFTGAFSGTYSLGGTPTINVAAAVGGTWTAAATWTLPALTLGGAITYGGVTLSNAVTGTGNMVLSASPTFTGTLAAAIIQATGNSTFRTVSVRDITPETNNAWTLGTDALRWGDFRTQIGQCYGAFSKGSGTFDIEHPILEGKRLRHSFVEGPRYDLIYRGRVALVDGVATVDLDSDAVSPGGARMTPGTFVALTRDPDIYLQNNSGWTKVRGSVCGATLTIVAESPVNDVVSWAVIAERQDANVRASHQCDEDARLILEYDSAELQNGGV